MIATRPTLDPHGDTLRRDDPDRPVIRARASYGRFDAGELPRSDVFAQRWRLAQLLPAPTARDLAG